MFYSAIIVYVILSSLSAFLVRKINKHYNKLSIKYYETALIETINYTPGRNIERGKYSLIRHFISEIIVIICLLTFRYLFNIEFVWQIAIGLALGLAAPLFACFIVIFFNVNIQKNNQSQNQYQKKFKHSYLFAINRFRDQIAFLIIVLFIILLFWPSNFILGFILGQIIILLRTHGLKMEYLQKEKEKI